MNDPRMSEFERELTSSLEALAESPRLGLLDRTMAAVDATSQRRGLLPRLSAFVEDVPWTRIGPMTAVAGAALVIGIAIGTLGRLPVVNDPSPSTTGQFSPSPSPSVAPSTSPPVGGWMEVTIQPRGGPGDLVVIDGHAGSAGLVLTGQLAGPLAEERGAVDPVAWYSQDGRTWRMSTFEMSGLAVDAFDIGPVYEAEGRLMGFGTGRYSETGMFTAVRFESSDGGATWVLQDAPSLPGDAVITDVAAGGPGYVAVGYQPGVGGEVVPQSPDPIGDYSAPGAVVWVSSDGRTWRPVVSTDQPPVSHLAFGFFNAVASNEHLLVAVGATWVDPDGQPDGRVWISVDGVRWTQVGEPAEEGASLRDVVAAADGFVAVGVTPKGPAAWWSEDGESWTRVDMEPGGARNAESVVHVDGGFVAVGDGSDHAVAWRSADGKSWGAPEALAQGAAAQVVLPLGRRGALVAGTTLATVAPAFAKEPIAWTTPP